MIKKYILCILVTLLFNKAWTQSSAQLTVVPMNPTPMDTIYVISSLTYSGNCSYGLVSTYTTVTASTIMIMPTYCGYGSSVTCVSTDTFKIPPLAQGNYIVKIEYHQGSVCPISGFDATIGQASVSVNVNQASTTGLRGLSGPEHDFRIFPNPAEKQITIDVTGKDHYPAIVSIRNILGEIVTFKRMENPLETLDLNKLPPGIYTVELETRSGRISAQRLLVR